MRYTSSDAGIMRRAALGPAQMMRNRRMIARPAYRGITTDGYAAAPRVNFGLVTSSPIGQGAGKGAMQGAAAGASYGPVGIVIGALVGALAGSIGKKDPEDANFQQAEALYSGGGENAVLNIPNKYLVLAGLFDLQASQIKGNIPIYKKYGRMGEQKFVTDMMNLIQAAANRGLITANDTPITVMNNIVQPWIDSWGYGPMSDTNQAMIQTIILGMVAEYVAGGTGLWLDVNGNHTFASQAPFSLPYSAPPVTPAGAVIPQVATQSAYTGQIWSPPAGYVILSSADANGNQIVQDPATQATYIFNTHTGQLVPRSAGTAQAAPSDLGPVQQDVVSSVGQTAATQSQPTYVSSGGGGGLAPYTPTQVASPMYAATQSPSSMEEILLIGGAALLGLFLVMRHR